MKISPCLMNLNWNHTNPTTIRNYPHFKGNSSGQVPPFVLLRSATFPLTHALCNQPVSSDIIIIICYGKGCWTQKIAQFRGGYQTAGQRWPAWWPRRRWWGVWAWPRRSGPPASRRGRRGAWCPSGTPSSPSSRASGPAQPENSTTQLSSLRVWTICNLWREIPSFVALTLKWR